MQQPGRDSMVRAASLAELACEDWMQDWPIEVATGDRLVDFIGLLESGMNPDGDFVGGEMTKVVRNTGQLSPADRAAMATYLKSLPPVEGPPKPAKKKAGS